MAILAKSASRAGGPTGAASPLWSWLGAGGTDALSPGIGVESAGATSGPGGREICTLGQAGTAQMTARRVSPAMAAQAAATRRAGCLSQHITKKTAASNKVANK
jgi:hypothetical protein